MNNEIDVLKEQCNVLLSNLQEIYAVAMGEKYHEDISHIQVLDQIQLLHEMTRYQDEEETYMEIKYCKDDFELMLGKDLTDDKYEEMVDYIERKIDVYETVAEMVQFYDEF